VCIHELKNPNIGRPEDIRAEFRRPTMALNVGAAQEVPPCLLSTPWLIIPKLRLEYIAGSSSGLYKHRKGYKLEDGIQGKLLDGSLAKNDLQPEQKNNTQGTVNPYIFGFD
jgi:hypothetical protein